MALGMVARNAKTTSASEAVSGEEGVLGAGSAAHGDRGIVSPGNRGLPTGRPRGSEHSGLSASRALGAAPWPQAVSSRSEARGARGGSPDGEAAQRLLLSGSVGPWLLSDKQPPGDSGGKLQALRVSVDIEPAELDTFEPESAGCSQPSSSRSRTAGSSRRAATPSPSSRSASPSSHRTDGSRLAGSPCFAKHGSVKSLLLAELLPGPGCKAPPSASFGPLSGLLESTSKCC